METPKEKLSKRNSYNRYKTFRKIKRKRKQQQEQQSKIAEKELKRRLRVTPPKYEDGKNPIIYPKLIDRNYDQDIAMQLGFNSDNAGHYPSRNPQTGDILKTPLHPTYTKALLSDSVLNYYPTKDHKNGRSRTATWKGNDYINQKFNQYNKYEGGKNVTYTRQNGNPIAFDNQGNLIDQVTGESGTMILPNVNVDPSIQYQAQQAYNRERDHQYKMWIESRPSMTETGQRGIPLQSVYPEFDLFFIGNTLKESLKYIAANNSRRAINKAYNKAAANTIDDLAVKYEEEAARRNAQKVMWDMDYNNPNWAAEGGVHYENIPKQVVNDFDNQVVNRMIQGQITKTTPEYQIRNLQRYFSKNYKDGGYDVYPKELFEQAGYSNTNGVTNMNTGKIALSENNNKVLFHELRHRLDGSTMLTKQQKQYAKKAYENFDETLKNALGNSEYDFSSEIVTTNAEARNNILSNASLNNASIEQQNKYIDLLSDEEIFDAVYRSNSYGRAYIEELDLQNGLTPKLAKSLRDALKFVPAIVPPVIPTEQKDSVYKSGKNADKPLEPESGVLPEIEVVGNKKQKIY